MIPPQNDDVIYEQPLIIIIIIPLLLETLFIITAYHFEIISICHCVSKQM